MTDDVFTLFSSSSSSFFFCSFLFFLPSEFLTSHYRRATSALVAFSASASIISARLQGVETGSRVPCWDSFRLPLREMIKISPVYMPCFSSSSSPFFLFIILRCLASFRVSHSCRRRCRRHRYPPPLSPPFKSKGKSLCSEKSGRRKSLPTPRQQPTEL